KGTPTVTDFTTVDSKDEEKYFSIITALESYSQHPLASAILKEADNRAISYKSVVVDEFTSITGKGIQGNIEGITYLVGSPKLFESILTDNSKIIETYQRLQQQRKTAMLLGTDKQILAVIAVADELRESSKAVIEKLHDLGIEHTIMLTGDNATTAQSIGKQT